MILAFIAAGTIFSYHLPTEPTFYEIKVLFDGYLPVLGGIETKAEAQMGLSVRAKGNDSEGNPQAFSSLKEFKVTLLDKTTGKMSPLPVALANAKSFFPDTTISHKASGKILKTDAPDVQFPFRLPGLHAKHFPDISYMLIEFPEIAVEQDKPWSYKRNFGGSEVPFEATYRGKESAGEKFELSVSQNYSTWEDENGNALSKSEGAAARISTTVKGHGFVWFEGASGKVARGELTATADSSVKSLTGEPDKSRTLKTSVSIVNKVERQ